MRPILLCEVSGVFVKQLWLLTWIVYSRSFLCVEKPVQDIRQAQQLWNGG